MNDYKSIYTNHYKETTYRFAFAYLVDNSRMNALNPKRPHLTLDEQRKRTAAYAKEHSCIVVKEFIEYHGDELLWDRAGFTELVYFVAERHPAMVIHAGEDYLNLRAGERYKLISQFESDDASVRSA
ncbi:MAG: hypothetical protein GX862_10995 [Leucobacter sp.]|nr:hypothetical protein [Leucobacter sp.]